MRVGMAVFMIMSIMLMVVPVLMVMPLAGPEKWKNDITEATGNPDGKEQEEQEQREQRQPVRGAE